MVSTSADSRHCANGNENGYMGPNLDIDWDNIGFGITPTDYMYIMKCSNDDEFTNGESIPYANIELSPAAGVLNYGQIPPAGKGSLYIRPLLLGTGPILGLSPAPEYTFIIYASPVANYFKEGSAPLSLYVEEEFHRASRGGAGGVKSITNYGPALRPLTRAKSRGFSDVLYLDSVHNKYVEEVSSCNIFIVKDNVISTPPTKGSILPGVTRKSVIEIARDHGFQVEERLIDVEELLEADEVFCTGTAVVVVPVGSITYQGKRVEYQTDANVVYKKMILTYIAIQNGEIEDKNGWIVEIN